MIYCLNPLCYSKDTEAKGGKFLCKKCGHLFINLHPHQRRALETNKRFVLVIAGIQGGKSEVGAKWLRDEIKKYWNEEGDFLVAAPCYDEQTQVLTDRGWLYFKDVKKSDKIACKDNDELVYEHPEEIYKERFRGYMYGAKGKSVDFLVTPNHRMLCSRAWQAKKWEIKTAESIYSKRYHMKRDIKKWSGGEANLDWMEFLGFWFAEGCAEYNEKSRKYRITVTQKKDVDYVDDLFKRINIKHSKNKRTNGGFNWVIYNKEWAKEFTQYGKSHNKKVPRKVLETSTECLKAFLKGYIKGDGTDNRNRTLTFSKSKELSDDIQEICLKVGWSATVRRYDYPEWKNPQYIVSIYKNTKGREIKVSEKLWYKEWLDDYVYCVKVRTGIIYTRRNGITLWSGNTYKVLWQSTLGKFLDEANLHKLGKFNKQDMVYTLKNGKRVFCRSTEDPNSLEAMTLRAAWLDEVGQMKRQVWINLQGRTSILEGHIMMTTTPYPNYWWPVNELIEPWKKKDVDYEVIEFDSIENPSFPKREFERAKRTLDARVFAMRYQGRYVKMSGLVYPDFGTANIRECPDVSKIITWIGGLDWGHNFAFGLIGRDRDGTYWKVKEYSVQGGLLKEHAENIKEICQGKTLFGIYYDPSEPGLSQEMNVLFQGMGVDLPLIPGNNDVELGINRVGQLLKARRYKISKSCANTIDEYEVYHRKSKEEGETKIVKVNDHNIDGDRYALLTYPDEELVEEEVEDNRSELEHRRDEGLDKIKEKYALKEQGLVSDSELGTNW